jgi:hypothetical protein
MNPTASLNILSREKFQPNLGIEHVGRQQDPYPYQRSKLGHPTQSLYWLSYHGHVKKSIAFIFLTHSSNEAYSKLPSNNLQWLYAEMIKALSFVGV